MGIHAFIAIAHERFGFSKTLTPAASRMTALLECEFSLAHKTPSQYTLLLGGRGFYSFNDGKKLVKEADKI